MEALQAGLLAWTIEVLVAITILLGLRREENRVIKQRENGREEES